MKRKRARVLMMVVSLLFLAALGVIFGASARNDPSPLHLLMIAALSILSVVVVVKSWEILG